jgi:DnaJ-class molecular chaperone
MPDPIPADDLYTRLGVSMDADTPAIDRAWRALLKQHHPDIAGAISLELAKLINVAHDWLSDTGRRARYDAAVHQREGRRTTTWPPARRSRQGPAPSRRARPRAATHAHAAPPDSFDDVFGARHSRRTTSTACRSRSPWTPWPT